MNFHSSLNSATKSAGEKKSLIQFSFIFPKKNPNINSLAKSYFFVLTHTENLTHGKSVHKIYYIITNKSHKQ
jgi:hypothetical protein